MISVERHNHALHLATHSGWYRFEQHGADWHQVDRALTYWQMSCIDVVPDNANQVYIGTEHSGLFVTMNGGEDWARADPNVPCLTLSALLALPGRLLVGTMPAALFETAYNSRWRELEGVRRGAAGGTFPPNPDLAPRTRVLKKESAPYGRLYAGIEVGGILASDDEGRNWIAINNGLTDPDLHQILPVKNQPGLVVAACGEGVSRSTDRGAHWERVTPGDGAPTATRSRKTSTAIFIWASRRTGRAHGPAPAAPKAQSSNRQTAPVGNCSPKA